jgi:hypothetical protein
MEHTRLLPHFERPSSYIMTEDRGSARIGLDKAQKNAKQRCLTCAIRANQTEYAWFHLKPEFVQRLDSAEALAEFHYCNGGLNTSHFIPSYDVVDRPSYQVPIKNSARRADPLATLFSSGSQAESDARRSHYHCHLWSLDTSVADAIRLDMARFYFYMLNMYKTQLAGYLFSRRMLGHIVLGFILLIASALK